MWEIFGAEQFINVNASKKGGKVMYLTNDMWRNASLSEYEEKVDRA